MVQPPGWVAFTWMFMFPDRGGNGQINLQRARWTLSLCYTGKKSSKKPPGVRGQWLPSVPGGFFFPILMRIGFFLPNTTIQVLGGTVLNVGWHWEGFTASESVRGHRAPPCARWLSKSLFKVFSLPPRLEEKQKPCVPIEPFRLWLAHGKYVFTNVEEVFEFNGFVPVELGFFAMKIFLANGHLAWWPAAVPWRGKATATWLIAMGLPMVAYWEELSRPFVALSPL